MAWDGTFDWRQDTSVYVRKWDLFIRPDREIRVATAAVLDHGTQVTLHNDGYGPVFEESIIVVRDQGDGEKNITAAKQLGERLVKALYQ
ncbi:hypothetical protein ACFYXL_18280 [Streptomyces tsukubensis]|uniref:hypothetical protein n=1 Tax=Streptomyces tsukubensis TaxID=83656 RepID=UPI0036B3513A